MNDGIYVSITSIPIPDATVANTTLTTPSDLERLFKIKSLLWSGVLA